jgi:hypothetical protein
MSEVFPYNVKTYVLFTSKTSGLCYYSRNGLSALLMASITMSGVLRTALIVCVVGVATESKAENILRGALYHWRDVEDAGVKNGALGSCAAGDRRVLPGDMAAERWASYAMQALFDRKQALRQFERNGKRWQELLTEQYTD